MKEEGREKHSPMDNEVKTRGDNVVCSENSQDLLQLSRNDVGEEWR